MNKKVRRRKRSFASASPKNSFSASLKTANQRLRAQDHAGALRILNSLVRGETDSRKLGKILLLTADSEARLGRYERSVPIYAQSLGFFRATGDPAWFSAAYGEIFTLLRTIRTDEACAKARDAIRLASEDHGRQRRLEDLPPTRIPIDGGLFIGPRPIRPTVVATRLGGLFLDDGYPDIAAEFFQEAVRKAPNGASRARQGLARIALLHNAAETAERYARESLQMGRFQAKTLHSWHLYHEARFRASRPVHDPQLFASMLETAPATVKDRTIMLVVASLRRWSDPTWKSIAATCVSGDPAGFDPIFKIELSKVLLAEAKIDGTDSAAVAAAAGNLLGDPMISPVEIISLSKTYMLYGLRCGMDEKSLSGVLDGLRNRFSPATVAKAIHSASLGAMLCGRHEIARGLLQSQVAFPVEKDGQWGRDMWALARMEAVLGNHAASATHFLSVVENPLTPPRFKIQGLLQWVKQIAQTGAELDLAGTVRKLESILDGATGDHRLLLDASRQLALAGPSFSAILDTVATAAVKSAHASLEKAATPDEVLRILNHLARRQYYELFRAPEIHEYWEKLSPARREWLWSKNDLFWEYQSLLILSYESSAAPAMADRLADQLLKADTTPAQGIACIAATYGELLIRRDHLREAIPFFEKAAVAAPQNPFAAHAYYWRALLARKRRNRSALAENAVSIRRCFRTKPAFAWEWMLDARGILLASEAGNTWPGDEADKLRYSHDYLERQRILIEEDYARLP